MCLNGYSDTSIKSLNVKALNVDHFQHVYTKYPPDTTMLFLPLNKSKLARDKYVSEIRLC